MCIEHFTALTRRGRLDGASDGETRARLIAIAVLVYAPGLDAEAIEGLHEFIDAAVVAPTTTNDLIR